MDERALQGLQQDFEVAVRQAGIANAGEDVLVGEGVEVLQRSVVHGGGFAGKAGDFGLDAVHQGGGNARRERHIPLDEIPRDQRAGRPEGGSHIHKRYVVQVAGRRVVVDDGVKRDIVPDRVPAGVRLTVHHDDGFARQKVGVLDRDEVQIEQLGHRPVFGPVDQAIAGQAGRDAELAFDQVSQPEHAAQAIRVGLDVGNERDPRGIAQPREKLVRPPDARRFSVQGHVKVGAAERHGCESSPHPGVGSTRRKCTYIQYTNPEAALPSFTF